jgi:hypothetical protein
MKIKHILLLILCVSILPACAETPSKPTESIQNLLLSHITTKATSWAIKLRVTGQGKGAVMEVNTGPMPACKNNVNGCMSFARNEKGKITFDMSGNDNGFFITQLKICKGAAPPVPLAADCPLSVNALDFYLKDTNGNATVPNFLTGKLEWTVADNIKTFDLYNENLRKQKYYYMVKACNKDNVCVIADPPLDNDGLG